jgi:hypothetical protein
MHLFQKVRRRGIAGTARIGISVVKVKARGAWRSFLLYRLRNEPIYKNPTPAELEQIEADLDALGERVFDYVVNPTDFLDFKQEGWFDPEYHGGVQSGVWDEKLLEHWIARDLLGLKSYSPESLYVDIAACNSPWARVLREKSGLAAFAIDLAEVGNLYKDLSYYRVEDATSTSFENSSVSGASLQCAYEMFTGVNDTQLIKELNRILKPGGKTIIVPLYMHMHYCAYSTPEYYGKVLSDPAAKEYLRRDCWGVPSSRKYDAKELKRRVLDPARELGMHCRVRALRNKDQLGQGIYCHFILEIENA